MRINNPGGSGGGYVQVGTVVYTGAGRAVTWTDLDVSSIVGAREVLCLFHVTQNTGSNRSMWARPNGTSFANFGAPNQVSNHDTPSTGNGFIMMATDVNGIVEVTEEDGGSTYTWTLWGYIA